MNSSQYTYLLQNPESISALNIQQLEEIISEFPYFQSARAILLNGLHKTNSYKYNSTLKKTAAYTVDRKVLFDFITSPIFIDDKKSEIDVLENIEINEAKTIKTLHQKIVDSIPSETSAVKTLKEDKKTLKSANEVLKIGKPIDFNSAEPHSFNEWMQLIIKKPIVREDKTDDKFSIIDKFIEANPKIKPIDKNIVTRDISPESSEENDSLMTETLAKVYLEQKKYDNAIKAYRILCLKYPEKSGFFADRIKAIKILQRNKS